MILHEFAPVHRISSTMLRLFHTQVHFETDINYPTDLTILFCFRMGVGGGRLQMCSEKPVASSG